MPNIIIKPDTKSSVHCLIVNKLLIYNYLHLVNNHHLEIKGGVKFS